MYAKGSNCVNLVSVLFLFPYERDFNVYLSYNKNMMLLKQLRYLDAIQNIDNPYFEYMVSSEISDRT